MKKPWSISTTVRNPERLRSFLGILKQLEEEYFNTDNQVLYQVLLIKEHFYTPTNIPTKIFSEYYSLPYKEMSIDVAQEIFDSQKYEDPPMRGRQSVNPLNKLGFCIARDGAGPIKITDVGNLFLQGEYDISQVFLKSLIKLQFPNPWSTKFSTKSGFNIVPFIAVLHLISRLNKRSNKNGLTKREFSIFVPTFINANDIDKQIDKIIKFRTIKDKKQKESYIDKYLKDFYNKEKLDKNDTKNLLDYGDNTMRYFRLTKYFQIKSDPLGFNWRIDLEPTRMVEINSILEQYSGEALQFDLTEKYLEYIADINKPVLSFELIENLQKIVVSLKNNILEYISTNDISITDKENALISKEINGLNKPEMQQYIDKLRKFKLQLIFKIQKKTLVGNVDEIQRLILEFSNNKNIRKYKPEQFEKLLTIALKTLNDEIQIKANYPTDDMGEPISHAPGGGADIECYYNSFNAICEVTLNIGTTQWIQEGQPIMRHLREFEKEQNNDAVFCLFVAPKIHDDTYSQYWISVKYEYDGSKQKIVPLTTLQFAKILKKLLYYVKTQKQFKHIILQDIYSRIVNSTISLSGFGEWKTEIEHIINTLEIKE